MLLSGPLLAGYTQTLNDFYDRDIDAINEPYRPILRSNFDSQVVTQISCCYLLGLVAFALDRLGWRISTMTAIALGGSFWHTSILPHL